MYLFDEIK